MARKWFTGKLSLALLTLVLGILCYCFLPESCSEPARRVAFIFVVVSFFWAFEIVPHFVTSLIAILLLILLVGRSGGVMGLGASGYTMFLTPFASPIIMLFFGGFALARALQKHGIDSFIAQKVLVFFGVTPFRTLFGVMCITALLSMWTSNTATTAIMLSLISPLVAKLDSDDPFRKGLILSVPFSANIGGIGTPIGTPPNVIALGNLADAGIEISFLDWMIFAVPLAIVLLVLVFFIITFMYPPKSKDQTFALPSVSGMSGASLWVFVIFLATALLWMTSKIHGFHESVIGLTALVFLMIGRFLDRDDIKNLDWDVLLLMWGGLALGAGMQSSGLAQWLINQHMFDHKGITLIVMFCGLGLFFSTFMSNTATATLIIPIAMSIPGQNLLHIAVPVALSCSFAMAFPISTPPNALAFALGSISAKDMIRSGALLSILSFIIMIAVLRLLLIPLIPTSYGHIVSA